MLNSQKKWNKKAVIVECTLHTGAEFLIMIHLLASLFNRFFWRQCFFLLYFCLQLQLVEILNLSHFRFVRRVCRGSGVRHMNEWSPICSMAASKCQNTINFCVDLSCILKLCWTILALLVLLAQFWMWINFSLYKIMSSVNRETWKFNFSRKCFPKWQQHFTFLLAV